MRISNIKEYLGGADNVLASDINHGDQETKGIIFNDAAGNPINLTNHTFSLVSELFTAEITNRGSSINIANLTKVGTLPTHTYPTANAQKATDNLSVNVLIPSTLLSDLDATAVPAPDGSNPYVIALGITANDNATPAKINTFRTLWIVRYTPQS